MPQGFDKCVKNGGRVRTITGPNKEHGLEKDEFVKFCFLGGKSWRGEVKKKKKKTSEEFKTKKFGSVTDLLQLEILNGKTTSIEFMRTGKWNHPVYGEIINTAERLNRYKENFEKGVRKAIPIDVEHRTDGGAVGWVLAFSVIESVDSDNKTVHKLMGEVEWTKEGRNLIKEKKFRFFSPEVADVYNSKVDNKVHKDVVLGGAITNRPFFEELDEIIVMSEQNISINKKEKSTMTLKEMLAKLRDNHKFSMADDASEEDKALHTEASAQLFSETAEKLAESESKFSTLETDHKQLKTDSKKTFAEQEGEAKKIFAELGVSSLEEAKELSKKMSESLEAELKLEVEKLVLPKSVDSVTKFALTLSEDARKEYFETLKAQGVLKFTEEKGGEGDDEEDGKAPKGVSQSSFALDQKAKKYMEQNKDVSYRDAVYAVRKADEKK